MNFVLSYAPLLLQGLTTTISAWFIAGTISLILGTILGICASPYVSSSPTIFVIQLYSFIMRGIPAYVHILISYFVIPALLDIQVSGFITATCALGLCSSGYITEIIRGGINAVQPGQWDACKTLGFSFFSTLRYIILPQTLTIITPMLIGEYEQLIKSTSLLAAIGVTDFTRAGMNIISRELNPIPVYCMIAVFYLLFSAIFNLIIVVIQAQSNKNRP